MLAEKRNIYLLSLAQAIMLSNMSLILTASALVGARLAENKALATLPIAIIFVAVMFTSIPAAMLMEKIGRRRGFMLASVVGAIGGLLASQAIMNHSFWLFTFSGVLVGVFNGFGNYFRFTAADSVAADYKSRAISLVMIGGVVAAFVGPNLASLTRITISNAEFAGSYVAVALLYVLAFIILSLLRLPMRGAEPHDTDKQLVRPLIEIIRQPKFIVALTCAMLGYAVMSFIMTATPLAMHAHNHSFSDTSFVIQWHVLGMFAPSFITGYLIQRIGVLKILLTGAVLGMACVMTNLLGSNVTHYWIALTLLGISWNFLFIGGTTLLTETYRTEEKAKVQALNDFSIFTIVTLASLTAGSLQFQYGWRTVNIGVVPLLSLVTLSIIWLWVVSRKADQDAVVSPDKLT